MDDDDESSVSPGIFLPQDQDENEPAESDNSESGSSASDSSDLDDSVSVDQPGSTIESPLLVNDDEEEEPAEQSPEQEPESDEEGSDHGQDHSLPQLPKYQDIRGGKAACGGIPCQDQCDQYEKAIQLRDEHIRMRDERIELLERRLRERKARLRQQITALAEQDMRITALEEQLRSLGETPVGNENHASSNINSPGEWKHQLRRLYSGDGTYMEVWRNSQQALNMSIDINMCHPQVRFVPHDGQDGGDEDGSSRQSSPDVASHSDEEIRAIVPLPDDIIFKILQELLTFDGLCHCFSRLDKFTEPTEFTSAQELLAGRFFFSRDQRSYLSLAHGTQDPNTVLAAVCVSKKFAWYSIGIFYSSNTFAFSSLGELDRFATGIGVARWQRCQNLELAWIGGKCVKFDLPDGKQLNRRTMALAWFCEAASLKTLVIHARETHRSQIRRKREPEAQKLYMTGKTAGQPNHRLTRCLRATFGIDYVYQLRGLYWVHVYDLDREIINPDRSKAQIRDQSFVIDVERVTTQEKVPSRAENSKLENLDPLWPVSGQGWIPSAADFDRIRPLFHEDNGYDNRPNDLDHDATSSQGTLSDSDDSEGEDSDSDSDSSGHSPPFSSRRRRPFTPAPGTGPEEEEELSETEVGSLGSVSDDDQGKGDSGSDSDDAFEDLRQRYQYRRDNSQVSEPLSLIHRARSEGGTVSHIDSDLERGVENSSDDEVREIPAPSSYRPQSRSSAGLFVTPGPGERTTTGTPDTRRRSTSGPRRATSARSASSVPIPTSAKVVDLTLDSDDEGEKRDKEGKKEEEVTSVGNIGRFPPLLTNDTKKRRLTSPSPPGKVNDTKRRLIERRSLPLPLRPHQQSWAFPKDV